MNSCPFCKSELADGATACQGCGATYGYRGGGIIGGIIFTVLSVPFGAAIGAGIEYGLSDGRVSGNSSTFIGAVIGAVAIIGMMYLGPLDRFRKKWWKRVG